MTGGDIVGGGVPEDTIRRGGFINIRGLESYYHRKFTLAIDLWLGAAEVR